MANPAAHEAFFLPAANGQRFCVYHPAVGKASTKAFLYIHPFAEEMNKSRRMANLQSLALAANGHAVLRIDLLGCGDSSSDFGTVTPQNWLDDIELAWNWLNKRSHESIVLWGLRLGATLALDFAEKKNRWPEEFLLWQPVLNGETFMSQFLRLRVASEMLDGASGGGVRVLRESLRNGEAIEVAGYRLNPEMTSYIDSLRVNKIIPKSSRVNWIELVADADQTVSPAAAQTISVWRDAQVAVESNTVIGPAFWATQEITDCAALIEQTTKIFAETHP
jgi:exosortase A-associated hydrolase 2